LKLARFHKVFADCVNLKKKGFRTIRPINTECVYALFATQVYYVWRKAQCFSFNRHLKCQSLYFLLVSLSVAAKIIYRCVCKSNNRHQEKSENTTQLFQYLMKSDSMAATSRPVEDFLIKLWFTFSHGLYNVYIVVVGNDTP